MAAHAAEIAATAAWLRSEIPALPADMWLPNVAFGTLARRSEADLLRLCRGDEKIASILAGAIGEAVEAGGIPGFAIPEGQLVRIGGKTVPYTQSQGEQNEQTDEQPASYQLGESNTQEVAAESASGSSSLESSFVHLPCSILAASEIVDLSDSKLQPDANDFELIKRQLFDLYPFVDQETIVQMLFTFGGDQRQVSAILGNFPRPGEEALYGDGVIVGETRKKSWFGVSNMKKKGTARKLPGEQAPENIRAFRKLRAMRDFAKKDDVALQSFATILTTPLRLSSAYFSTENLVEHYDDEDHGLKKEDQLAAQQFDMFKSLGPKEIESKLRSMWRVKLILTSLNLTSLKKFAGQWKKWRFGMVHAAVQVGPVILEWGPSSIIIPDKVRDFSGGHVLLALDVGRMGTGFVEQYRIVEMCRTIARWNANYTYSVISRNCQHFVEEILNALGMQANLEGEILSFIDSLQAGHDEKKVQFTFKGRMFRSHAALDAYVASHPELNGTDYNLLKAYDRAFWLRYNTLANALDDDLDDDMVRLQTDCAPYGSDQCPFGDPSKTGTFLQ